MVNQIIRILGIDPGYGRCGWGVIEAQGNRLKELKHGVIETKPVTPFPERLKVIHDQLEKIIKKYNPDEAAIEELFFAKNVKTAINVGQARGVILLTCATAKLSIGEYKPGEIKQAVTGYGTAKKQQVQQMIRAILNLSQIPKLDDAADALAVAICHAHLRLFKSLGNMISK